MLIIPAALVLIKGTIVDSTAFKTVPLDLRNLRSVANISSVIDDNKLLAFITFKSRVINGRGFRNYGRRGDNNCQGLLSGETSGPNSSVKSLRHAAWTPSIE
jgi:hypothetical protein